MTATDCNVPEFKRHTLGLARIPQNKQTKKNNNSFSGAGVFVEISVRSMQWALILLKIWFRSMILCSLKWIHVSIHQFMIHHWWSLENNLPCPQVAHNSLSETPPLLWLLHLLSVLLPPSCLRLFIPWLCKIPPHPFLSCLPNAHSIPLSLCVFAPCVASCGWGVEWACLGSEVGVGLGRSGCHSVWLMTRRWHVQPH